jgi:hypothetical protein
MNRFPVVLVVAIAAMFLWAPATPFAVGASIDFDNIADGTNLLGTTQGDFSFANGGKSGGITVPPQELSATGGVLKFADNTGNEGEWKLRLVNGIDLTDSGAAARVKFDWKTQQGYQGRASISMRPWYSVNTNYGAEDWIANHHNMGLSDNGYWWIGGAAQGSWDLTQTKYVTDNWYRSDITITSNPDDNDGDRGMVYAMELFDLDNGGASLGTLNYTATGRATRDILTAISFSSSSNANEVLLLDNISFNTVIPEPTSGLLVILGSLGLAALRRRQGSC